MTAMMQRVMEKAYARWQADDSMSMAAFHATLSPIEEAAVFLGNLNYQVENGGFSQWHGNGYASDVVRQAIKNMCRQIGTPAALEIKKLVEDFEALAKKFDITLGDPYSYAIDDDEEAFNAQEDEISKAYYKVNEQFLIDANDWMQKSFKEG